MSQYNGKEVDLIGFIYPGPGIKNPDEFYVTRSLISCCIADAMPIGIPVDYNWSEFKPDDWVEVKGIMSIRGKYPDQIGHIIPKSIYPTIIPERPYIY